MNTLNTQRVQLPDGTCVKIEGGDATSTAALVANYLGLPGSVPRDGIVRNIPPGDHDQPVLIPPVMNFRSQEPTERHEPVEVRAGEEPCLLPPVMNFKKPAKIIQQAAGSNTVGGQAALVPPRMDFSRK